MATSNESNGGKRFIGNGKNYHLRVTPNGKFVRYIQEAVDKKTGKIKRIKHEVAV